MTIKTRNRILFAICVTSVVSALAAMVGCFICLVRLAPEPAGSVVREFAFLDLWKIAPYNVKAAALSVLGLALFMPFITGMIFFYFEKTRTKEVLFLAVFALSCSLESLRFAIPVCDFFSFPFVFAVFSSKVVLFFRILAAVSLFGAALSASDVFAGDSTLFLMIVFAAAFLIASYVPVNSLVRLSSFFYLPGCYRFISIFTMICGVGSAVCYWLNGITQSISEYRVCSLGCLFAFCGYWLLIHCDSVLFAIIGGFFFFVGFRMLLRSIRQFYKWS